MTRSSRASLDVVLALLLVAALVAAVVGATVAAQMWIGTAKCTAQWGRSGMQHEFRLIGGCMVRRFDGTWIPAASVRDATL